MSIILDIVLLVALFAVLGWVADIAVNNIKKIAITLKVRLFAFGILLGMITTLPELALGINAVINQVATLSVGNLLGGVIVMICLILGVSLVLNRQIKTDGDWKTIIPIIVVIFSPILLGINGKYQTWDGLIIIALYMGVVFYLYRSNRFNGHAYAKKSSGDSMSMAIFYSLMSVVGVLLVSHWIVDITIDLLEYVNVSQLVMGLLVFSIGTNLPEISISIASWRKKTAELSLSHLLSSALTNILVLGVLAFMKPISFNIDINYWILVIFLGITLILFTLFYHSGKKLDRREGFILLSIYVLFVVFSVLF